ncbi:putative pentatricopeptide repeat-containing protein At3g18840 isoform X1 [Rhododendron vialii]|uniref:putative pentatricopeptide repeat-containing protein At3g18840 isoform X1 n=1 Tax=Rhododendron vialii TaxID=182163 RepID=UPI00265F3DFD|nr:putative pentatricopeptide repeat-containing protein At3g18840 isoform X1 [Rhododendron vialii]
MRSLKDGLKFHCHAIKAGLTPIIFTSNQLINLYSRHRLMQEAQKLFDEMPERNVFTWNAMICAQLKTQNLNQAQALFDSAPEKDSVTYNSMLSGFVRTDGYETHALKLFLNMQSASDGVKIDVFTLATMLNFTAKICVPCYGKQLQSFMVKTGNDSDGFVMSALIDMYSKCGCFRDACQVFNVGDGVVVDLVTKNAMVAACCREGELEMARDIFWSQPELNDTVSWNTLISGYAQNGYEEETIKLFGCMSKSRFRWNEHTFASVLSACSGMKNLKLGKEVHAWVLKDGMYSNPFISSGIVDVYSKCGNMNNVESVYAAIGLENSFSITSMIVGYSFQGNMVEARRLFDSSFDKNFVMWTAMFSGYVKSQQCEAVFELLKEFNSKGETIPDASFLISGLGACSLQAAMGPGKQIHAYVLRSGIEWEKKLISAMVDMYSKCGNIMYARFLFERAIVRDSILYNVMIAAYAHHGYQDEAIQLFDEMLEKGFRPDEVTFLALLSACRHGGLVELGEKYFYSMAENYAITPESDHYACVIDLYGRSNQLEKAVKFMRKIPIECDAVLLGTFLNACKMNRNVELAREAEEELLRIGDYNRAGYVQLANVYAAEGKWVEMGKIRKKMRGKEVKKFAGCSWLYVENRVGIFTSGYRSHSQTEAIYSMLDSLNLEMNDLVKWKLELQHSVRGFIS